MLPEEAAQAQLCSPREHSFIVVEDYDPTPLLHPDGRFCLYLMAKRGLPTPRAAALLARSLGAWPPRTLGLKDAEATTLQLVCLPCPPRPPRHLLLSRHQVWARLLGRARSCPRERGPRGNCFTVVLHAPHHAENVAANIQRLAAKPIPAYYGYQRFGTRRPNTHLVGLHLLRGGFREALEELAAKPYPDEAPQTRRCRLKRFHDENCRLPGFYEAHIAAEASQSPGRALKAVPPIVKRLALQALQALIYNLYTSLRLQEEPNPRQRLPGERPGREAALAPIPGVGYRLHTSGHAARILEEAAALLNLDLEELANPPPGLPKLQPYWRPLTTRPYNLKTRIIDGDTLIASFCLEKGMYATTLLREVTRLESLAALDPNQSSCNPKTSSRSQG